MKYLNPNRLMIAAAVASSLLLSVAPVAAVTTTKKAATTTVTTASTTAATAASNQTRIDHLKTRGAAEIDRRLTTLHKLTDKVNASTKLSDADKKSLSGQISSEVTSLTALKTKLAADTDLAVLRTDVQSIVTEYRVYRLLVPQASALAASDRLLTALDALSTVTEKLSSRVAKAQAEGKDVSALTPKLTAIEQKLTDTKASLDAVNTAVAKLTPADYNSDKTVISAQRQKLAAAQAALKSAASDAKDIITSLKSF